MRKRLLYVLLMVMLVSACSNSGAGIEQNKTIQIEEAPPYISGIAREGLSAESYVTASVEKVVDGDTVDVIYKKQKFRVRLLDIDTPESVKEGLPVQPFAKEAAKFTKDKALYRDVKLVFGKGLMDKYGRFLAYVVLKDGTFLNAELVRNGFARVEIIPPNTDMEKYFYSLQDKAIREKAGLWALPPGKQPFILDDSGKYIPRFRIDSKAS
jgi:micrococcal nuclease